MKIATLDLENDNSIHNCRKYLDYPYRDPENRPWLCTVSIFDTDKQAITFTRTWGIRLPQKPRLFTTRTGERRSTGIYHDSLNRFPATVVDCGYMANRQDYTVFFQHIAKMLTFLGSKRIPVYFKGFGTDDNFDREVLSTWFRRCSIDCNLGNLVNIYSLKPGFSMPRTAEQVKKGSFIDNQTYMLRAIQHNIEDAQLLAKTIAR